MTASRRPLKILGIAGSLRRASYNRALLRAAIANAPEGLVIAAFELDEVPLYNEDLEAQGVPQSVKALRQAIADCDAVLIATPEYNYSVTAVLKNAIDWSSRRPDPPLREKPVAMMGASVVKEGSQRAQAALRQILLYPRARVMEGPELAIGRIAEKCDPATREITDTETLAELRQFLEALRDWLTAPVES